MKFNSKTITITTPSVSDYCHEIGVSNYNKKATELKAQSLAVLVGNEYNKFGRHTDLEMVNKLREEFDDILVEMILLMKS